MNDTMNYWECDNLSMMPYLQRHGLNYTGKYRVETEGDKTKLFFLFEDPHKVGSDLAMAWNRSEEKDYRDLWSYFKNEISRIIKELNNAK